ncbi:hypothetical protein EG328_006630 [Venturia inaequalis]|uniref:BTB domain-containing protein n=1 Tax=Venturia inaequalis TaxID=5025 RepID=A0A8H3YQW4_VENIN|nr:hypothetical protein EG328_006630 [Venturia inaequalis]KAE9990478.1 hypothetical protein EG327_001380 [Venturia inaequalis]RDI88452.1 hypothetical protein Vi05172_g944 [Venturia inaequalis]
MSERDPKRTKIEAADPLETVIDPEGDLRLVVGPDAHSIIVSSKILCVASTVFKEKLLVFKAPDEAGDRFVHDVSPGPVDGKMSEAEDLDTLLLPNDNAKAMILLCNILHFRSQEVPSADEISTGGRLFFFASMVHKYACINAVRPITVGWLSSQAVVESIQMEKLLVISYRLEDAALFFSSSHELLLTSEDDFLRLKKVVSVSRPFPSQILDTLQERRSQIFDKLVDLIFDRILKLSKDDFSDRTALQLGYLIKGLKAQCLWPELRRTRSLENTINSLASIKVASEPEQDRSRVPTLHKQLEAVAANVRKSIKGLCLDCVRADGGDCGCCDSSKKSAEGRNS